MELKTLSRLCSKFKTLVASVDNTEELFSTLGEDFKDPKQEDQQDIIILLKRAHKALISNNINHFIETMIKLDKMVKQFKPEKFEPEFAEFITDQDTWNYIYELKKIKEISKQDMVLLNILKNELLYLSSKHSLIV